MRTNYEYEYLFRQDSIPKELKIVYDTNQEITNDDLELESFEWHSSLCSESQFRFGCCESDYIKFSIGYGITPLEGKRLKVYIKPKQVDDWLLIGNFYVVSDTPTADKRQRSVIAYDRMYFLLNDDLTSWYNSLYPTATTTVTIINMARSLAQHWGMDYQAAWTFGSLAIPQTIFPNELSGKDVLCALAEMNLCFIKVRNGTGNRDCLVTQYVQPIGDTLYPAEDLYPADDLYPQEGEVETEIGQGGTYIDAKFEDYFTAPIDKFVIRNNENDVGYTVGSGDNAYVIENNFLLYGKSTAELDNMYGQNALNYLGLYYFTPAKIEAIGNPCLDVGDRIRVRTKYATIDTYILQRTLKGIQALRDTYIAESPQKRSAGLLTTNHSLIALRGKTNELTRTIEETKSVITDEILDPTNPVSLQSQITQNATSISTEVTRATGEEGNLSSRITQNATDISLRVEKSGVISAINQSAEAISIDAGKINLNGAVTANTYFKINTDGSFVANKGTIGDFTVENGEIKYYHPTLGNAYMKIAQTSTRNEYQIYGQYLRLGKRDSTIAMDIESQGNMSFYTAGTGGGGNMSFVCNSLGNGISLTSNTNIAMSANSGVINFDANKGYNMYFTDAQTADKHLTVFGDVTATSFTNASDRALKYDIMEIPESVINALGKVELKQFRFKDDTRIVFGAIAQDLKSAMEEAGMEESDYRVLSHFGEENYYALNYIDFLVVKNAYLEKRIDDLEKRLEQIERRLNNE